MLLLDLPVELFKPIIHMLVEDVGVVKGVKYRVVCKAFAVNIAESTIDIVSKPRINTLFHKEKFARLFKSQCGAILYKKVLHSRTEPNHVVKFASNIVDDLLRLKGPGSRMCRNQYAADICNAMSALDPRTFGDFIRGYLPPFTLGWKCSIKEILPAIASAIGDADMLRKSVTTPADIFHTRCHLFPNALSAAVASGQISVLRGHLSHISKNVKSKPGAEDWKNVRIAAKHIGEALTVAIRLHMNEAGAMLLNFLEANCTGKGSQPFLGEWLFKDAIRHTNKTLIYRVLEIDHTAKSVDTPQGSQKRFNLSRSNVEFLLSAGNKTMLTMLLKDGHFDPNKPFGVTTPLAFALDNRRCDLARVLLKNGADVNQTPENGDKRSALWHAAIRGYTKHVEFLLRHSADPGISLSSEDMLIFAGDAERRDKCVLLIEMARRKVRRPDI